MLNIYSGQNHSSEDTLEKNKPGTAKPVHSDFRKYVDSSGELQSQELVRGIWLVSHRVWIYRLIVLVLILLNIFLWMIGFIKWGIFLLDWQTQTNVLQQLSKFPSYTAINKRIAPENLQVLDADLFESGVGRYDAATEVSNPNRQFMVSFDYYFLVNGSSTPKGSATLLPNESRPLAIFGLKDYDLGDAVPVIEKVRWTRINRHRVSDAVAYQGERLDFTVSNFVFTPAQVGDGAPVNILTFEIKNNSPYSYIEPKFVIGMYNGEDNLVGVMPLTVASLYTLETRKIDVRNFVRDQQVSDIKLFPLINVYDKEAFVTP